MWIVRLALRRPYTFIVVSILIGIVGVISIRTTPTDILPAIDIPVYIRDVAQVRDGAAIQTNIVRQDGKRGAQLSILKSGSGSWRSTVKPFEAI